MDNDLFFDSICKKSRDFSGFSSEAELILMSESSQLLDLIKITTLKDNRVKALINTLMTGPYDGFFVESLSNFARYYSHPELVSIFIDAQKLLLDKIIKDDFSDLAYKNIQDAIDQLVQFCLVIVTYRNSLISTHRKQLSVAL